MVTRMTVPYFFGRFCYCIYIFYVFDSENYGYVSDICDRETEVNKIKFSL